jgi:hypothetical protein
VLRFCGCSFRRPCLQDTRPCPLTGYACRRSRPPVPRFSALVSNMAMQTSIECLAISVRYTTCFSDHGVRIRLSLRYWSSFCAYDCRSFIHRPLSRYVLYIYIYIYIYIVKKALGEFYVGFVSALCIQTET